ncbi:MAG: Nitrogen fixation protein VnfA [Pseudomonadota bacterium]|jgi:transcriptional regulator with PAS, ATPase and Fis domain
MKGMRIPPLSFGVAENLPVTAEGLIGLLGEPQFSNFMDQLSIAVLITGPDDTLRLFNSGAEAMFGVRRMRALGRPLAALRRDSLIDMEDFLVRCARGAETGKVHARNANASFSATRRSLARAGEEGGWNLYFFAPDYGDAPAQERRQSAAKVAEDALILPAETHALVDKAVLGLKGGMNVLLYGETGVGKTVLARQLHERAAGAGRSFVHVNCGGIPESLFESELFGYERGAFTGALQGGKQGYIERAAGGTLFLDEIGELPPQCQAKLLKFLEDGSVQPVGGAQARQVDTKVICATNRDLQAMVRAGSFRLDLFHRIAMFSVRLPALRGREAIARMLDAQLAAINARRPSPLSLAAACRERLLAHRYEGNVREMRNILEYVSLMAGTVAETEHLPEHVWSPEADESRTGLVHSLRDGAPAVLRERVRRFERALIAEAVASHGTKREAARQLGIDVATLIRKERAD